MCEIGVERVFSFYYLIFSGERTKFRRLLIREKGKSVSRQDDGAGNAESGSTWKLTGNQEREAGTSKHRLDARHLTL